MSQTLGEKLRQAREERGISISEVSEQTRIAAHHLESIEDDNYKTLPGGIFNKGFVKTYAKFVGIDEQEALQDYAKLAAADVASQEDELKAYKPEVLTDDRSGTSIIPTVIIAVLILGLMSAGILFLVNYIQNRGDAPVVSNTNSNTGGNSAVAEPQPTPAAAAAPAISGIKVEFASDADVSLTALTDGKRSSLLVTPGKPATFEPKESLKLSYSKSLAAVAKLSINGKPITLPSTPENPRRAAIEFEINSANLPQIWQSGAIAFDGGAQSSAPSPTPVESGSATVPTTEVAPGPAPATTAATAQTAPPRPVRTATPPRAAATPRPVTTQTPIIVGRPAATPRPN